MGGDAVVAGTAGALKLRRSAMLLRITQARESRQRRALAAAQQAAKAAAEADAVAGERQEAFGRARLRRMDDAHQALHGRVVDLDALDALARLDGRLGTAAASLEEARVVAREAVVQQEARLRAAKADLRDASRMTVRRTRMLATLQRASDRAAEGREDAEQDDQASERWQPCAIDR